MQEVEQGKPHRYVGIEESEGKPIRNKQIRERLKKEQARG
jgi:hypothetical protein